MNGVDGHVDDSIYNLGEELVCTATACVNTQSAGECLSSPTTQLNSEFRHCVTVS